MGNTLTGLIPIMYEGLDRVSREMVGLTRAVSLDSDTASVAKGQTVRSPVAPEATTEDITPGAAPAASGGQTIGYADIVMDKMKASPILWSGNEQVSVGKSLNEVMVNQFEQSIRALVNLVEADLATTGYKGASLAYGTAGTAPFGTAGDFTDFAGVIGLLESNGAPKTDLQLALGSAAMTNLRGTQSGLFEANRAGTDDLLRRGVITDVMGLAIRNSSGISGSIAKGTGTSYVTDGTYTAGDTVITVDTGTGTVLAGDIVTFAGDTNKYIVATGIAAAGDVILAAPGLKKSLADGVAMTIGDAATRNLGFARSALHLATRQPAMATDFSGNRADAADDVFALTDPASGITFQVAVYAQYHQVKYEVGLCWGTATIKPEHLVVLLG